MDQSLSYAVDIVLCIDGTASMRPVIDRVKTAALDFYPDLMAALHNEGKRVDELRVKAIVFRDFDADGAYALQESAFYELPAQSGEFGQFINTITEMGGGDEPESGYEALSLAMQSDWTTAGDKRRHLIVVWTDASAHPIEKANRSNPYYPPHAARTFDELYESWDGQENGMNFAAKRMILFAPEHESWAKIGDHWQKAVFLPSRAGEGMSEIEYSAILDQIVGSI